MVVGGVGFSEGLSTPTSGDTCWDALANDRAVDVGPRLSIGISWLGLSTLFRLSSVSSRPNGLRAVVVTQPFHWLKSWYIFAMSILHNNVSKYVQFLTRPIHELSTCVLVKNCLFYHVASVAETSPIVDTRTPNSCMFTRGRKQSRRGGK